MPAFLAYQKEFLELESATVYTISEFVYDYIEKADWSAETVYIINCENG